MKILTARMMFTFLCARCLHTHRLVSRPLGSHTSTSTRHTQISRIPARYNLRKKKKKKLRMTVEPSYGREGDRFWMTVERSYGRERVNILSNTITWYNYPSNSWIFFLPTAPSILLPGLGSKDGWEQAPSHVALRLTPLGSWLQIPNTRLSGRPLAGHRST